jgi:protein-disulfide isomerase
MSSIAAIAVSGSIVQGILLPQETVLDLDREALAKISFSDLAPQDSRTLGSSNAEFTAIVFSDLGCGACHQAVPQLIALCQRYENLRLVYRHFPLRDDSPPALVARLIETLDDDSFWEFLGRCAVERLRELAGYQSILSEVQSNNDERARPREVDVALAESIVTRDLAVARQLDLPGTPMIILVYPGDSKRDIVSPETLEIEIKRDRNPQRNPPSGSSNSPQSINK